jgi:large subunit ribosomal protein L35
MRKMKSNSGAKKRFRLTASGKVKYKKAKHSHILTCKSTKLKRKMRRGGILPPSDEARMERLLPYGSTK